MSCGSQPVIKCIPKYLKNAASKEGHPFWIFSSSFSIAPMATCNSVFFLIFEIEKFTGSILRSNIVDLNMHFGTMINL